MRFVIFVVMATACTQCFSQSNANISVYVDQRWIGKKVVPFIGGMFPNSAATKAGLQLGDVIISINGQMDPYGTSSEIDELMYGKAGTPVVMEIKRFGVKKKIRVIRSVPPRNGAGMSFCHFPAIDSIKNVTLYNLYTYNNSCVVGDCVNGIGMKMQDSVLIYANFAIDNQRTVFQLRTKDRYEETEYLDNIRDGRRNVWFDNGSVFTMNYKDGKLHGIVTQKEPDGSEYESVFEEGVKISERVVKEPRGK